MGHTEINNCENDKEKKFLGIPSFSIMRLYLIPAVRHDSVPDSLGKLLCCLVTEGTLGLELRNQILILVCFDSNGELHDVSVDDEVVATAGPLKAIA